MAFTSSAFGQTEVVVVEFQPAALLAAVSIERFDRQAIPSSHRAGLTSTKLSKNVAPPPMSVRADDVVLLTLKPPGDSLFQ
jgi:hypothetical protein